MFRIQENDDGTTVVYCNSSGKQIFVLQPDHQPKIPERTSVRRPINVVGPSRHVTPTEEETTSSYISDQDKDTSDSKNIVFPTTFDDVTDDYFNDSVEKDDFARCLNLVPKRMHRSKTLNEVLKEFPLRLVSRSKAYRSKDDSFEEQKYQKPPDDLPLTSKLGIRFLKLNEARNFLTEQKLQLGLKKCETFSRFPFNSPNPVDCNFPKLRCREKSYPTLLSKTVIKQESNHFYTYGRRQRMERMRTLRTGLSKRSRQLFRTCNTKQLKVNLQRLEKDIIDYWLSKKTVPVVITIDDSDDDAGVLSPPLLTSLSCEQKATEVTETTSAHSERTIITSKNVIPNKNTAESVLHSLLTTSSGLVRLPKHPLKLFNLNKPKSSSLSKDKRLTKLKGCRDCYVRLTDVSKLLYKLKNNYYVKYTKISVPFYSDHLASISLVKRYQNNYKPEKLICFANGLVVSTVDRKETDKKMIPTLFATPQNKLKSRALVSSSQLEIPAGSSKVEGLQVIPYIDLTVDSSPEKEPIAPVPKHYLVTKWDFRCYGCGYKRLFTNHSVSYTKAANAVNRAVKEHLITLHSVDKPDAYLTSYLDTLQKCSRIEAFPGYKDN